MDQAYSTTVLIGSRSNTMRDAITEWRKSHDVILPCPLLSDTQHPPSEGHRLGRQFATSAKEGIHVGAPREAKPSRGQPTCGYQQEGDLPSDCSTRTITVPLSEHYNAIIAILLQQYIQTLLLLLDYHTVSSFYASPQKASTSRCKTLGSEAFGGVKVAL